VKKITMLRVLEAQQAAIGRERATQETALFEGAEPYRLWVSTDLLRTLTFEVDVYPETVFVTCDGGHDAGCLGESAAPTERKAVERGLVPTEEGFLEPTARLVAALVLEPDNTFAVDAGKSVYDTHGMICDPSPSAALEIESVHLTHTALRRDVDDAVGGLR
jgi:hypothetical protein